MVDQSGASFLFVSGYPDSPQYHPLLYRTDACGGKSMQCTVTIRFLLSVNDLIEKLRKNVLDTFPLYLLRGFSNSIAVSLWTVYYRRRHVPEPGNHQFERSYGTAG